MHGGQRGQAIRKPRMREREAVSRAQGECGRRGRGGKGNRGGVVPSQAALDAEMDAYMAKRQAKSQASAGQPSASVDFDNVDDVGNLGVLGE